MKISNIVSNNSIKLLSGLANNDDSLASMVVKDWIGDGATVYTYSKAGTKDDAREKAIEEFGTGAVWLFAIPALKKVIDKTIYPIFKLNPDFDPRILDDKNKLTRIKQIIYKSESDVMQSQKDLFKTLDAKNPVWKKFTNSQLYKGFAVGKFAVATAISAVALASIIKLKHKTTNERIQKDIESKRKKTHQSLLSRVVNKNKKFVEFTNSGKSQNVNFTGNLAEFMYNPIKNTMILDGVITTTRLKEARDGERKEVAFKELFQLVFVYGLAKPIQKAFEFIGNKTKCPIELDPKVLFTKGISKQIEDSSESIKTLAESNNVLETLSEMATKDKIDPLIKLLDNDGVISTIKDKKGDIKGIDYTRVIDEKAVKNALGYIEALKQNIGNLSKIKAFKAFAVVANVLIAAGIMGVLQPKLNILMRKILNHGDNRNPAIVEQEKLAMQGKLPKED